MGIPFVCFPVTTTVGIIVMVIGSCCCLGGGAEVCERKRAKRHADYQRLVADNPKSEQSHLRKLRAGERERERLLRPVSK